MWVARNWRAAFSSIWRSRISRQTGSFWIRIWTRFGYSAATSCAISSVSSVEAWTSTTAASTHCRSARSDSPSIGASLRAGVIDTSFMVRLKFDNYEFMPPEKWEQRYAEALVAVTTGQVSYMNVGIDLTGMFFELGRQPSEKRFYKWPATRSWR